MHLVFRQTRSLGDVMLDKPVVDNFKPEPLGEPGNNIFAECSPISRVIAITAMATS